MAETPDLAQTRPASQQVDDRQDRRNERLAAFALTLGVVLLVELPDKTLVATLVLSTRYRQWPVLVGVASAFAVQCVVAAVAGGLLHLLPHRLLEVAVAVLFLGRCGCSQRGAQRPTTRIELAQSGPRSSAWRIALTCFGVLFVAEWGDASQLATAALVPGPTSRGPSGSGVGGAGRGRHDGHRRRQGDRRADPVAGGAPGRRQLVRGVRGRRAGRRDPLTASG